MYIIAIAWIYVVLLMSMTEHSVIAGIMTFLLYCIVPLSIILYLIGTPRRKRARQAAENAEKNGSSASELPKATVSEPEQSCSEPQ